MADQLLNIATEVNKALIVWGSHEGAGNILLWKRGRMPTYFLFSFHISRSRWSWLQQFVYFPIASNVVQHVSGRNVKLLVVEKA